MKFLLLATWDVVVVAAFVLNTRAVNASPVVFPEETWPLCYIGNEVQGTCEHLVNCQPAVVAVYRGLHPPACYWQRHQTFPIVCCPRLGTLDDVLIPVIPPVTPVPSTVQQEACGRLDTLPQISGDSTLYDNHVWPWMVSIYKEGEENIPVGSGFLIDDKHVLTAAQSFPVPPATERWNVRLERTKRDSISDQTTSGQVHTVQEVKIHEGFRSWVRYDDLALVTLNDPVENAQPLCLPSSNFDPNALAGINTTVLGLNREEQVPVVSSTWCNEMYTKFAPLSYPRGVDDEFFCAGLQLKTQPEPQSAGNMGGPVMMQTEDGAWMAVGLVSLDYQRTEQGLPGVYLNLAHYKDWIDEQRAASK